MDRGRGQSQGKKEGGGRTGEKTKGRGRGGRIRRWVRRRWAGKFSPILDDEVHQGQGGLAGDSDSQVQGELSRCLGTRPDL